ncbi:MAG TPA: 1,4-alpha-glucan branching protein domain-containing protein [Solirubrobacteraceae bacterium]|nr:1,4-alpha-glucan branching protein domain-containing protein [Solirubrobacteraceae bacterium]
MPAGELAMVLHTHMPYVEGFGTWPFGEEWLWEAAATSYVPLLRVLDGLGPEVSRTKLTLSLTPVLCDQLEAPGALERCVAFLREIRPESHRLDIEELNAAGESNAVAELERSADEYAAAADRLERLVREGGLVRALGRHATWTSAASHAILPLLALDDAVDLQLQVGIDSYRHRFGDWGGGFWLPECAHAPWLNGMLIEAGIRGACIELTNVLGYGSELNLRPQKPSDGPALLPIDRATIDLVWGEHGYPSRPPYRDYHRRTRYDHHVLANDGSVYDYDRARRQAGEDAREFVTAVRGRLAMANGGLCICAVDTELLGHWWYEGPVWLESVLNESERQGLALTALDVDAIARHSPVDMHISESMHVTSWGSGSDLRTWSEPSVADLAWQARDAELHAFLGGVNRSERALRELLALQSSDWAFLAHRGWAGDYPRQRASGHAAQLSRALKGETEEPHVRNLAPYLELRYS